MPKTSNDTKLTVLSDHYKETVAELKKTSKSRDTNFLAILILLGVMAFQFISPEQSESVLTQFTNSKLGIDATLSINLLGSLVWFGLLYVATRYFQAVINIEKQYNYTHDIEEELASYYKGKAFTREGKAYLKDYPVYSDWVHFVYRSIFPALFLVVTTVKIVSEWRAGTGSFLPLLIDSVAYFALFVSVVLYVYSLRETEKDTEKDVE